MDGALEPNPGRPGNIEIGFTASLVPVDMPFARAPLGALDATRWLALSDDSLVMSDAFSAAIADAGSVIFGCVPASTASRRPKTFV